MKQLIRPKFSPPSLLQAHREECQKHYHWYLSGRSEPRPTFKDSWNEDDVRGLLHAIHGNACAYCFDELKYDRSQPEVDHFRPKRAIEGVPGHHGYWWLSHRFINTILACRDCNTRKKTKFPLADNSERLSFDSYSDIEKEQLLSSNNLPGHLNPDLREERLLLDPFDDPVDQWLELGAEPLPYIQLTTIGQANAAAVMRWQTTESLFELNTLVSIKRGRVRLKVEVTRCFEQENWDSLREMAFSYRHNSWTVRQLWKSLHPETFEKFLPTAAEDQLEQFKDLVRFLQDSKQEPSRTRSRLLYALAALWLWDLGNGPEFEKLLAESGYLEAVRERYREYEATLMPEG